MTQSIHPQFKAICKELNLSTEVRSETGHKQLINVKPQNRKYPFIYRDISNHSDMKCTIARAGKLFGIKETV
jgi:hypothetical protein